MIFPKAQLSSSMSILMSKACGTLTATGTIPTHQVDPGKYAVAISRPFFRLRILKVGDSPVGNQE